MKTEKEIQVSLKDDYKDPEGWTQKKELPAGKPIIVTWISRKGKKSNDGRHKGHTIRFITIEGKPRFDWVEVTWNDVVHPKVCILSEGTRYDEGSPMLTVYCATQDDFVGVEPTRTEDINYCPLCGKEL